MTSQPPEQASPKTSPLLDWNAVDTLLLDMDGTLLDLHYDNTVWNIMVPEAFAVHHNVTLEAAKTNLFGQMARVRGQIEFYCFDYWSNYCDFDVTTVHHQATDLIRFRPGAEEFLRFAKAAGKKLVIATNAHWNSIAVKNDYTQLLDMVDATISSHDFNAPKEHPDFWHKLVAEIGHTPERSAFLDDNEPVLDAAQAAGIGQLLCIETPDSQKPLRQGLRYSAFDHFSEITP